LRFAAYVGQASLLNYAGANSVQEKIVKAVENTSPYFFTETFSISPRFTILRIVPTETAHRREAALRCG